MTKRHAKRHDGLIGAAKALQDRETALIEWRQDEERYVALYGATETDAIARVESLTEEIADIADVLYEAERTLDRALFIFPAPAPDGSLPGRRDYTPLHHARRDPQA